MAEPKEDALLVPDYAPPPPARPWWVAVGMVGLPNRISVRACFWFCILGAVASVPLGFWSPICFLGIFLLLPGAWYWGCVYWIDRYGRW